MSKKNKDQLSEHIKQVMIDHEEPYVLGSWEKFERYKTRKNNIRRRKVFLAIAASIILVLTFRFAIININTPPEELIVEEQQTEQQEIIKNDSETPSYSAETESRSSSGPNKEKEFTETEGNQSTTSLSKSEPNVFTESSSPVSWKSVPEVSLMHPDGVLATLTHQKSTGGLPARRSTYLRSSELSSNNIVSNRFVEKENIRQSFGSSEQKHMVFSVAYASVMNIHDSQTDLGAGGGFYTDWNFAKNLSLSSGLFIAQNRLKYQNGQTVRLAEGVTVDSTTTLTTHNLDYVQLDFVNLEIPLNIRYSLTDELSVSAGISSMAFLKEEYEYNFKYEQQIQVFRDDETTGPRLVNEVVTVRTTQTQSEPSLNRMNWAAFYTFSVGYQQRIFQRYTASFEPFIKIPAGRVTSRGISYATGGVQLKVSF